MDQKKERELSELMDRYGREDVCLAFSGGVDSSLLLKLACDTAAKYHTTVWAVTFDTMLHPACDMENARRVARELNASHVVLTVDELEQEELRRNPVDRCYLCKRRLFSDLKKFAEEKGCSTILDGTNEDDLHVYRPGIRALRELGIVSPLALCGMTKQEVKELAARLGISAASRPSTPCMATRLPYGAEVSYELLKRIEEGEEYLRSLLDQGGKKGNIRLRIHADTARIEVDEEQLLETVRKREQIVKRLKELGFTYVTLDLEGFRSGSMDVHLKTGADN